ncbi:hypothetical protein, partial [Modestobacter sp. SSW1-42]|uniref:hypothetical protein n=1 Tax=Modestobacter sp. SSW1-42 TaxID=596372 RepID=UPI003987B27A
MKVLVTVKAAPQPSATYGDTVCVAGVELRGDDPVRLVRLYPVPFRYLEGDQQFGKYQVIDVAARPSTRDPRPESLMALAECPQGCSSKVPTRVRGQVSGRRVPVAVRRRVSVRAW